MTTGKTIALTRQTFAGKVMSLLFNRLSRFAIAFLPRSKCLFISWLQSPFAVILESKKIKSVTVSIVSPSMPWSDGAGCHDLLFLNVEFTLFCCCGIYNFWMLNLPLIEPINCAAQGNKGRKISSLRFARCAAGRRVKANDRRGRC